MHNRGFFCWESQRNDYVYIIRAFTFHPVVYDFTASSLDDKVEGDWRSLEQGSRWRPGGSEAPFTTQLSNKQSAVLIIAQSILHSNNLQSCHNVKLDNQFQSDH